MALCQETDTESHAIHLSKSRSYHQRHSQGHVYPHALATTTIHNPPQNSTGQAPHPDTMDLSATGGRGKISEEERAARLREGCCLYCGGVGHMARHCPNKTKNPFRAASTYMEGNPNMFANPNPNTFANPNPNTFANPNPNTFVNLHPNTFANPFSGDGGGGNKGSGRTGGQGQSGNA